MKCYSKKIKLIDCVKNELCVTVVNNNLIGIIFHDITNDIEPISIPSMEMMRKQVGNMELWLVLVEDGDRIFLSFSHRTSDWQLWFDRISHFIYRPEKKSCDIR